MIHLYIFFILDTPNQYIYSSTFMENLKNNPSTNSINFFNIILSCGEVLWMEKRCTHLRTINLLVENGEIVRAIHIVAKLKEPVRTFCIVNIVYLSTIYYLTDNEIQDLACFASQIKKWTNEQLIDWYGQNSPLIGTFSPLAGKMTFDVLMVYREIFGTNRFPQDEHVWIQSLINDKIKQRIVKIVPG